MAKILIVDDSTIMRRNLKSLLTQAGHEVVAEASDGNQAFHQYVKYLPDLVTMDITMPVMNGIDAVKKIISSFPDANIVMISALDQKMMVFDAIQHGAKHYILKPITVEKLLTSINEVLEKTEHNKINDHNQSLENQRDLKQIMDPPFSIRNENGSFIITIYNGIDEEHLASIQTAIQGILFIKPLHVIFKFEEMDVLLESYIEQFLHFITQIEQVEGTVKVWSKSNHLIDLMKGKNQFVSFEKL